ncbi:UPF0481 protein At3g47200-like, partial [Populus alba]|uniref:UPF0481 protein At3g47200-like n=1 Tax=Populus alba TaxID=43335 RepID=UPI001588AACB
LEQPREPSYVPSPGDPDRSDEVSLDISIIADSLTEKLEIKKAFSGACCIYRVPEPLRELNAKACAPRVVSIGPFHHNEENLEAMENHKIMYLQQFLKLNKVRVEDLIDIIKLNEAKLRDSYAETVGHWREGFATIILVDAVFIIMLLLKLKYRRGIYKMRRRDHIFYPPFKLVDVLWDMCLLENQLPFFILKKLFERVENHANPDNRTLIKLTCLFLRTIMDDWVKEDSWEQLDSSKVLHFVHFIRKCQRPKVRHRHKQGTGILRAPTATELHQSGVKFMHPEQRSLLDVTFSNGILEIPQLKIHGRTEILFRNLKAFEKCHYKPKDHFVSDYITFISCLVRAPNDVVLLAHKENLKNLLNSDEAVSNLLCKLHKESYVNADGFLSGICEELTLHCRKRRHEWKATLKQVYFNNPWTGISVVAAFFLLVLTVIQTVCSILQLR